MQQQLTLHSIVYSENGTKMTYQYTYDESLAKFFNKKEPYYVAYQENIASVPESIAVIPFLANIMPIAWFVGFDVYVNELDETFYHSLQNLKAEFAIHFPQIKADTQLHVAKKVSHSFDQENHALLFSGGLDAFESLTRNIDKNPYLISVHGADIEVADTKRWNDFKRFNLEEEIISEDRLCYVESNLRTFYTYEVDLLVGVGWWGKIQHGMALLSLIAPLSYLHQITTTMIASSNTGEVSFGWGSTSETDEKVRWANQKVIHDGFHLRRTEKIENIVTFAKKTGYKVKLRVCYSEWRTGYNCSRCTKCQRTMFGFILEGENPNDYGFEVPQDFYDLLLKNFNEKAMMTVGVKYEWQCLQDKAKTIQEPYIVSDKVKEIDKFNTFVQLNLDEIVNKNKDQLQKRREMKFVIINKFPKLFQFYLKLRRKL
jgi:hypothetical protein